MSFAAKALSVLPETELPKPIINLRHCGFCSFMSAGTLRDAVAKSLAEKSQHVCSDIARIRFSAASPSVHRKRPEGRLGVTERRENAHWIFPLLRAR
jgi:hypothetical protein